MEYHDQPLTAYSSSFIKSNKKELDNDNTEMYYYNSVRHIIYINCKT